MTQAEIDQLRGYADEIRSELPVTAELIDRACGEVAMVESGYLFLPWKQKVHLLQERIRQLTGKDYDGH